MFMVCLCALVLVVGLTFMSGLLGACMCERACISMLWVCGCAGVRVCVSLELELKLLAVLSHILTFRCMCVCVRALVCVCQAWGQQ